MCHSQKNPLLICYTAVSESNNVEYSMIFSFHYYHVLHLKRFRSSVLHQLADTASQLYNVNSSDNAEIKIKAAK